MVRKLAAGSTALCLALSTLDAMALVTEPNGMVVPVDSQNGEEQLYTMFQSLGEAVDWQAEGMATPNAFSPMCDFTATFVLHQSACSQALAWYNETGQTPANADLHIIIPAGSPIGQVFTGTDIKGDPAYTGGLVGFAIVGDPSSCAENHHTNPSYNNVCSACANPGPWITAVIYASKNTPNSYYVGFEDGATNASSWNNDGDFNDDVFFITGVTCAGGGQPCDTGKPGVCAVGVTQCVTGGTTVCKQTHQPSGEKCDALDNNCDGTVDEGDICAAGFVCVKGKCVPKCGGGEFNCPIGKTCSNGYCIETACVPVTNCPAGQVCVAGKCVGACDGVVCPQPQACVAGLCVDACAGVTCPQGQVCEKGACVTGCDCAPCGAGLACNATTKHCTDPACASADCPAGQICQAGNCVDACTGASCPSGQVCKNGQCEELPSDGDAAGSGGSPFDGGLFADTGAGGKDASAKAGGSGDGGAVTVPHGSGSATGDEGGCGCRAAGRAEARGWLAWLAMVALMLRVRRARRVEESAGD